MNLQNKAQYSFQEKEIHLLVSIAKQVAGAIENARLHEETVQKNKQIEALSSISRLVTGKSYLDEILRLTVSITADSLGFKICSLMLLNENQKELSIVATQSLSTDYREKPPIEVAKSLSGRAVQEKKPIAYSDVRKEPEYKYPNIAQSEGLVSLLSVPMMVKDRCVGVLNSYTPEPHNFTETEIKTLASVAHQAAIAIENTRLGAEVQDSKEALESRKLIEKAKGVLMKEKSLTEDCAFQHLRKASMNQRKTLKQVAEAVLLAQEIRS